MATKKNQTNSLQTTVTILKDKATQLNKELLIASDELVEGSIATGERIQDLMAKVLKNGTTLLEKQQELTFDTIEALLGQYKTGNMKFKKLLGFDKYAARKAKAKKQVTKAVNKKRQQLKAKATSSIDGILPTSIKEDKPVTKKTTQSKRTAKKRKVVTKTTATVRKTTSKVKKGAANDFTIIEGIGPKIAGLLNKGGIKTYKQLAKTDVKKVKEILAKAGKRYNAHDPTTWGQQAELAAAGKWEVLQAWKNRLKGGTSSSAKRVVIV